MEVRIGPDAMETLLQSLYAKLRSDALTKEHNYVASRADGRPVTKHRKWASIFLIDARDHLGGGAIIWGK